MQTDILTWVSILLATVSIISMVWLIIYSLRNLRALNIINDDNTKTTNKLYRVRFAISIVAPLIALISIFYIVIYSFDNFTDTMMLSSGPYIFALVLALFGASATLFILSYINIRQIKRDLSSKQYLIDGILHYSKKILYLIILYSVILILPFAYFFLYFTYDTSANFIRDNNNNQRFSKVHDTVSYTNAENMLSNFLFALNESDSDKAFTFYYPNQKGSDVIPNVESFIQDKDYMYNDDYRFTESSYSPESCKIDNKGNRYYDAHIGSDHYGTYSYIIKDAQTNKWYILAVESETKTTDCKG